MRGKFVTFEGCEGVGKSTQLNLLKDYLKKTNQEAVYLREPGGTNISEQIRKVILSVENNEMNPLTEAYLYVACRAQLVNQIIRPALEQGKNVICDRFIDSSIAYQGKARELGVDFIKKINEDAIGDCTPDLTVFIDLPPDKSFRKVKTMDRLEQENAEFHQKVYDGYIEEAKRSPERVAMITPEKNKFDTHTKIIELLKSKGVLN